VPLVSVVALIGLSHLHLSRTGILLAGASGALTSGVDYAIWYAALRGLSSMQAAKVQLSGPVLAAVGGDSPVVGNRLNAASRVQPLDTRWDLLSGIG
jgi:hypothetical protein